VVVFVILAQSHEDAKVYFKIMIPSWLSFRFYDNQFFFQELIPLSVSIFCVRRGGHKRISTSIGARPNIFIIVFSSGFVISTKEKSHLLNPHSTLLSGCDFSFVEMTQKRSLYIVIKQKKRTESPLFLYYQN